MLNFYDILDITENASAASILKAYKKRALFYHPDKNPSHRNEFSSKFRQVAEAYSILIDSRTRKKYDADLLHDRGVKLEKIEIERRQTHERCELHSYESHYGENFTNSKALALFEKVFKDADQNEECDSKVTYCNGDSPASAALNRSTPGRSQFWDRNHAQVYDDQGSCSTKKRVSSSSVPAVSATSESSSTTTTTRRASHSGHSSSKSAMNTGSKRRSSAPCVTFADVSSHSDSDSDSESDVSPSASDTGSGSSHKKRFSAHFIPAVSATRRASHSGHSGSTSAAARTRRRASAPSAPLARIPSGVDFEDTSFASVTSTKHIHGIPVHVDKYRPRTIHVKETSSKSRGKSKKSSASLTDDGSNSRHSKTETKDSDCSSQPQPKHENRLISFFTKNIFGMSPTKINPS